MLSFPGLSLHLAGFHYHRLIVCNEVMRIKTKQGLILIATFRAVIVHRESVLIVDYFELTIEHHFFSHHQSIDLSCA